MIQDNLLAKKAERLLNLEIANQMKMIKQASFEEEIDARRRIDLIENAKKSIKQL